MWHVHWWTLEANQHTVTELEIMQLLEPVSHNEELGDQRCPVLYNMNIQNTVFWSSEEMHIFSPFKHYNSSLTYSIQLNTDQNTVSLSCHAAKYGYRLELFKHCIC